MSEKGDIGRIDGRMGIGAAFEGFVPFVQVARLLANGRYLAVDVDSELSTVLAWYIGDLLGDVV